MSDNCENSTDREFDDYLRKEEPADLIPRLENVLERLEGHDDQELDVAGDIVEYVINQLDAMDEDTTGELEQGLEQSIRDAAEGRTYSTEEAKEEVRKRREETSENSLGPAAWLTKWKAWYNEEEVFRSAAIRKEAEHDDVEQIVSKEPLVRMSDVRELLEKVEREAEAYTTDEEDPVTAFKHGSEFVLSNIRERLEEFTQNGDTE